jgi:hypothetical protein
MAYEVKALAEKLKSKGLEVAEDAAKVVVEETLQWVAEEAVKSENKIDDLLVAIIPVVKPHILAAVDKIDQKEG